MTKQPTYQDIHMLRSALQRMVDEEYELEASGDNGTYNVSELSHVIKANEALFATQHLDRVEHVSVLKSSTLDKLEEIQKCYGLSNDQALEMVINEFDSTDVVVELTNEMQLWLKKRPHYEPGSADEMLTELREKRENMMVGVLPKDEMAQIEDEMAQLDQDIAYLSQFIERWQEGTDRQEALASEYND